MGQRGGGEEVISCSDRKNLTIHRYTSKSCKQCNSTKHWTTSRDFLKHFTLKNEIYYPKKRVKDSDEPSSDSGTDKLSDIIPLFHDSPVNNFFKGIV